MTPLDARREIVRRAIRHLEAGYDAWPTANPQRDNLGSPALPHARVQLQQDFEIRQAALIPFEQARPSSDDAAILVMYSPVASVLSPTVPR